MYHLFKYHKTCILSFNLILQNDFILMFLKASCICEFSNSGKGRNGVMCNNYGVFQNLFSCYDYQFCTGPTRKEKAVKSTDVRLLLCSGRL